MKSRGYKTVEEMRAYYEAHRGEPGRETRFEGTTTPRLAFKYFSVDDKILECGPHEGAFSKLMLEKGYKNLQSIDFYDALQKVKKEDVNFQLVDFNTEKFPLPDNYFKGATAWGIGEHMENPYFFMREVHRVLEQDGIFIFALPNVFHIVSRLVFLKKGDFPRWNKSNNHITVFTHQTFKKTFLRYFDVVEIVYKDPSIQYSFFNIFDRFLPANEWFGNYIVYVLKKKSIS